MRTIAALAILCSLSSASFAEDVTISLPDTAEVERSTVRYQCEGLEPFDVEYINAGDNSLAIVPVEGKTLVFVSVLSGSGARYASGAYVWWSKGRGADLYDERAGPDAEPIATCEEAAG